MKRQDIPTQKMETEDLRRRCSELEREVESLHAMHRKRLTIAADVHRSLIPGPVRNDRILVDVRYIPVEDVGGDYCQVRFPDQETCYITMCDVMGHGVGSALLATRISGEVRYGMMYRREPREILKSLERFMSEHFSETGLFLTFVAARIDLDRRELTWSGAGHPSPLVIRPEGREIQYLASQNPIIGLNLPNSDNPLQETVPVRSGDRLFFFTDGLFEVLNADERQLGLDGFAKIAKTTINLELFDVADHILQVIHEYQSGPDADDQTLVVGEIR